MESLNRRCEKGLSGVSSAGRGSSSVILKKVKISFQFFFLSPTSNQLAHAEECTDYSDVQFKYCFPYKCFPCFKMRNGIEFRGEYAHNEYFKFIFIINSRLDKLPLK